MGEDFFVNRREGRILVSRVGAEFAGAARGAACGSCDRISAVRAVALQQAGSPFQLALRLDGDYCWHFLRARVAPTAARAGLPDYPPPRGLDLGGSVLVTGVTP